MISEIYKEIKAGKIVNRLIQGDVGSGKTVVSMIMLLYMAENHYQGGDNGADRDYWRHSIIWELWMNSEISMYE